MHQSIFLLVLFSTALLAAGRSVNRHRAFVELAEDGHVYRGKVHVNGVTHNVNLRQPEKSVFAPNFRLTEAVADSFDEISFRDITPSGDVQAVEKRIFIDEDAHAVFRLLNESGDVQLHGTMKNMHISHDGENHFAMIHEYPGNHYTKDYLESNWTLADDDFVSNKGISKANPELHLTVDYKLWTDLGEDESKVLDHLAIMVHGANRRFKTIDDPVIVFQVVESTIIKDRSAQPFIENTKTSSQRGEYNQETTLKQFGAYMYKLHEGVQRTYDLAALISGETYFDSAGLAYRAGACNYATRKINGVDTIVYDGTLVISEEKAVFIGVFSLAHELAHSMGAPHDENKDGKIPGWDTGDCAWKDGYIMSYDWDDNNVLTFSKCSIRTMKKFIDSDKSKCVQTVEGKKPWPESSKDPGSFISLDQQCAVLIPLRSRKKGAQCADGSAIYSRVKMDTPDNKCIRLWCECDAYVNPVGLVNRPLDGTPCKDDGSAVCQEGKCVDV